MPSAHSNKVSSNQIGVHPDLVETVERHRCTQWRRPTPAHTDAAARDAIHWISSTDRPVIIDSFCGTAMSTAILASRFPNHIICGVDQSESRLSKHQPIALSNYRLFRAECETFWRELSDAGIVISKHFLLYPNPWPKKDQVKRRVHGHPSFPLLAALGGDLELRCNWQLFAEEFEIAAGLLGYNGQIKALKVDSPMTLFEHKYHQSAQQLWVYQGSLN